MALECGLEHRLQFAKVASSSAGPGRRPSHAIVLTATAAPPHTMTVDPAAQEAVFGSRLSMTQASPSLETSKFRASTVDPSRLDAVLARSLVV